MPKTKTDITIEAYNRNADKYAQKFMDFKDYQEKITIFQEKYIPENANILDVGCGPGNAAKWIVENDASCKITGIDLSPDLIRIARKQNMPMAP